MKLLQAGLIATVSLFVSATPAAADVLDRARAGEVQCYAPDAANHTCQSIGAYRWDDQGRISNEATVLLATRPTIVVSTTSEVRIVGDAVCGRIRPEDVSTGRVLVGGQPTSEDVARQVLEAMVDAFAPYFGHEVCTAYRPSGDHLLTTVTFDGEPQPDLSIEVVWVNPRDGWRVGWDGS